MLPSETMTGTKRKKRRSAREEGDGEKKEKEARHGASCQVCCQDITRRLSTYLPAVRSLSKAGAKKRMQIIRDADPCLVRIMKECALNVLKGRIKLSRRQLTRLRPHARTLVKVSRGQGMTLGAQKKLLEKSGGFLPVVLPALIASLGTLAGNVLSNLTR